MKKAIQVRVFFAAFLFCGYFYLSVVLARPNPALSSGSGASFPQDFSGQKFKYDYMSTFLSRSTKPLGLKEDLIMKKLLKQPRASWATRAGIRHILD